MKPSSACLFDISPDALALVRASDGVLVQANPVWLAMLGYSHEEALSAGTLKLAQWLDATAVDRLSALLLEGKPITDVSCTVRGHHGRAMAVKLNAAGCVEAGELCWMLHLRPFCPVAPVQQGWQTDMLELAESMAKVCYWVHSAHGEQVQVSTRLAMLAGLGAVRVTTHAALIRHVHPEDVERFQAARERMDGVPFQFRWLNQSGQTVWLLACMRKQVVPGQDDVHYGMAQPLEDESQVRAQLQAQLTFIQTLTSRAPGVLYQLRMWPDGHFVVPFVSEGVTEVFGVTPAQVALDSMAMLAKVHPDDAPVCLQTSYVARDSLSDWKLEFRIVRSPGDVRWVLGHSTPQALPGGSVLFTGAITDITQQKQVLDELTLSEARFRSLSNLSSDWYWEQDAQFRFTRIDGFPEKLASVAENVLGFTAWEAMANSLTPAQWQAHKARVFAHETFRDHELPYPLPDGSVLWMSVNGEPIFDHLGQCLGYRGTSRDITVRKTAEAEIERLAFFDALTGLPNRRLLFDRLQQALLATARSGLHGAVLYIDLDNFKSLNDTLGHQIGDLLLQQVGQRLLDCVRTVDTVARIGGDEFVVMLEDLDTNAVLASTQAELVGRKILSALNTPFVLNQHVTRSSPSMGVTLFSHQIDSIDEVLKRADLAMYQAKGAGRNTLRFFDQKMQLAASERAAMEADLWQALQEGQFSLYYQPVVDAAGRMSGVEALLRWVHPVRGMVSPATFIPLAEHCGIILPLGQWVLEAACAQLAAWSHHPRTEALSIAVNVSVRQFRHPDFSHHVLDALGKSGANPRRLKLELTESMLVSDVEEAVLKMHELRAAGLRFLLDDFGTGYSSLSYLKRLPLDQLKIDQSFVRDVLTDPNDAAIARTILSLAKSLDLGVVAEGVETKGQYDFLLQAGCTAFQGYFFGRPVPISELPLAATALPAG